MKVIMCNKCKKIIKGDIYQLDIIPPVEKSKPRFQQRMVVPLRRVDVDYDQEDFCSFKCMSESYNSKKK